MIEKLTLLCVDDDPRELAHNKKQLEEHGYHVLTALDGPAAMTMLEENRVDGVVLEYQMSPKDGEAVAMDIWRKYVDVPIILFSSHLSQIPARLMTAVDVSADKGRPVEELLAKLKHLFHGDGAPAN